MALVGRVANQVNSLWEEYKKDYDLSLRNELISRYIYLVRYVVNRFPLTYSTAYDNDDLIGYGMLGLIDAIEKFDLGKGVKFETYALARIKGAILDSMRKLDWVPRSVRQKAKDISIACAKIESEQLRPATDSEIIAVLNISQEQFVEIIQQISQANLIYLEEEIFNSFDGEGSKKIIDLIEDGTAFDPSQLLETEETKKILIEGVNSLQDKEKTVLTLYYYEGLTLKEIGLVMGLSESRISQLHTKAIMRMRGKLSKAKSKGELTIN